MKYTIEEQEFIKRMRALCEDGTRITLGFVIQIAKLSNIDVTGEMFGEITFKEVKDVTQHIYNKLAALTPEDWDGWYWELSNNTTNLVIQFVHPEKRIVYAYNLGTNTGSISKFWSKGKIKVHAGYRDVSEFKHKLHELKIEEIKKGK